MVKSSVKSLAVILLSLCVPGMISHGGDKGGGGLHLVKIQLSPQSTFPPWVMRLCLIPANSPAVLLRLDHHKRIGAFAKLVLFRDRGNIQGGAQRSGGTRGRSETYGGEERDEERKREERNTLELETKEERDRQERSESDRQDQKWGGRGKCQERPEGLHPNTRTIILVLPPLSCGTLGRSPDLPLPQFAHL